MSQIRGDSEYALQYFNFTPENFFREFSQLVLEEMSTLVQNCLTEFASPACPLSGRERLREQVLDMHKKWCDGATNKLHKVEPIVKSYFTVPRNVLLHSDRMCKRIYSEDEVKALEVEVAQLEKSYGDAYRDLSIMESLLDKSKTFEQLVKLVDDSSTAIKPISSTIKDIKNLDSLINFYIKARSKFLGCEDDCDLSIVKHKHMFRSIED